MAFLILLVEVTDIPQACQEPGIQPGANHRLFHDNLVRLPTWVTGKEREASQLRDLMRFWWCQDSSWGAKL